MATWADIIAGTDGRLIWLLEITGFRYVLGTDTYSCTESWYTDEGYEAVKGWLTWDSIRNIREEIEPLTGLLAVKDISVLVVDDLELMTAEIKSREELSPTQLTATITDSATTINVGATGAYSANDIVALGQERIKIGAVASGTQFTGCTRGWFGTTAMAHTVDLDTTPVRQPFMTSGPVRLAGRPCRLRVAVVDANGAVGNATVVYRGIIGEDIDVGAAHWEIPIEHISSVFSRQIGRGMRDSGIQPYTYSYSGGEWPSLATTRTVLFEWTGSALDSTNVDVTVPYALYSTLSLSEAWTAASVSAFGTSHPALVRTDEGKYKILIEDSPTKSVTVQVREGDALWMLGFKLGNYIQPRWVGTDWAQEAQDEPRIWGIDLTGDTRPYISVVDAEIFTPLLFVAPPNCPYLRVAVVSGTTVTLAANSADSIRVQGYAAVEADKEEDLLLKEAFVFSSFGATDIDTLHEAIQRSFGQLAGQKEPDDWTLPHITAADVDFDELTVALGGAHPALNLFADGVTEPTEWQDVFGGRLGILAIAPRITTDGKIGWARIETPTEQQAQAIELDADMWELKSSPDQKATIGVGTMTSAELKYGYDYRSSKWPKASVVNWYDWAAEVGKSRAITYDMRGLEVSDAIPDLARDRGELDYIIATAITSTHFGLFGREAAEVEIPCTRLAWQLLCGQVIKVTHPLTPNTPEGVIGVSDRLALVVARDLPTAREGVGSLTVRIPPVVNAAGISPCALGDGWTVGTLTMDFSGADTPLYAKSGGNDLSDLAAVVTALGNTDVQLWEYNIATPTGAYPLAGTVTAVDTVAKTVVFDADPFSGGGIAAGGVEMTWPAWDDQNATQQEWVATADTAYGLGAAPDDAFEWGM